MNRDAKDKAAEGRAYGNLETACRYFGNLIREVKHDVYGKRQTVKMKLLPSVFSSLYGRVKIFLFAVNSKRHFYIFV